MADRLESSGSSGPAGLVGRRWHALWRRCPEHRYAPFLRRTVRCAARTEHAGEHRYSFLDEVVIWTTLTESDPPLR